MADPKPIAKDSRLWRRVPDIHWVDDGAGGADFRPMIGTRGETRLEARQKFN